MASQILFIAFALLASAAAYEIVEDGSGQHFYLVPLHRQRRQTSGVQINPGNPGVRITGTHQGTIYSNGVHQVDGNAMLSKTFRPSGPLTAGGGVSYQHLPSGSGLNLNAQHTPKYGTDFSASGNANLWQKGNSRLDAVGTYGRHYGGFGGTGRPDYYGGLQFTHRF